MTNTLSNKVVDTQELANHLERIGDVLHDIADRSEDEGDRVYFGSTNDPHTVVRQVRYLNKAIERLRTTHSPSEVEASARNVYRLQMGGVRLCDALRRIANGCEGRIDKDSIPALIAAKALAHNEPDPKDWNAALSLPSDKTEEAGGIESVCRHGIRHPWQCDECDREDPMPADYDPLAKPADKTVELLREAGSFIADLDCECDSYNGHECRRCKVRAKLDSHLGEMK